MQSDMNEDIFDAVLQRAFCDYTDEQLSSYPDCATLAKMYPLPKKEKRAFDRAAKEIKYGKPLARVYLARAAVIFLCIIAFGVGAMLISPAVRAAARNVIIEWFNKYTHFSFVATDTDASDFESIDEVKIGYVPDGYKLIDRTVAPENITYTYSSDKNFYMDYSIDVFKNETSDLFSDNRRSEYIRTKINGHETWIVYNTKNGGGSVILVGAKISVLVNGKLPKEEMLKIAESIG